MELTFQDFLHNHYMKLSVPYNYTTPVRSYKECMGLKLGFLQMLMSIIFKLPFSFVGSASIDLCRVA